MAPYSCSLEQQLYMEIVGPFTLIQCSKYKCHLFSVLCPINVQSVYNYWRNESYLELAKEDIYWQLKAKLNKVFKSDKRFGQ